VLQGVALPLETEEAAELWARLTADQLQVVEELVLGFTPPEIADRLAVSRSTVYRRLDAARRRLRAPDPHCLDCGAAMQRGTARRRFCDAACRSRSRRRARNPATFGDPARNGATNAGVPADSPSREPAEPED
jgi:DNA-binding CsgD family transcriptional regulator